MKRLLLLIVILALLAACAPQSWIPSGRARTSPTQAAPAISRPAGSLPTVTPTPINNLDSTKPRGPFCTIPPRPNRTPTPVASTQEPPYPYPYP